MSGMSVRGELFREVREMAQAANNNEFMTRERVTKLEQRVEDLIEALRHTGALPPEQKEEVVEPQ
jgi:hypothetical protein